MAKNPKSLSKVFSAVLTRTGGKLNWVTVRLPFDASRLWGKRGQIRIKGEIEGFPFRSNLFPTGDGHHYLIVNKKMQKGGRVNPGVEARFLLEPDTEERVSPVPLELEHVLRKSKRLQKFFQSLTPYTRRWISDRILEAKHPETRLRRAEQAAEQLLETLEAEIELPPMIRQVFARNPEAAKAWRRMSPSMRRGNLLGIFYYRSPEARLRRIQKTLVELAKDSSEK